MMPRQAVGLLTYGIGSSCKALVAVVVEHQDMSQGLGGRAAQIERHLADEAALCG